jgi:hypothetical protein
MLNWRMQGYEHRFEWFKPQEKNWYFWEEREIIFWGQKCKGRYLMERDPASIGVSYSPLEDTTLFTRFAAIPGTAEALLQWVNQYGRLTNWDTVTLPKGIARSLTPLIVNETDIGLLATTYSREFLPPESLANYIAAHCGLEISVILWECVSTKDEKLLHKVLNINKDRTRAVVVIPTRERVEKIKVEGDWIAYYQWAEERGLTSVVFDINQGINLEAYDKSKHLDDFGIVKNFLLTIVEAFTEMYPVQLRYKERQF